MYLLVALAVGGVFFACSSDKTRSSSGGGEGGEGGDAPTTGSKAEWAGGGGNRGPCDNKGMACGTQADPGCQGCAQMGECKDEAMACQAVPDCPKLDNCNAMCAMGVTA